MILITYLLAFIVYLSTIKIEINKLEIEKEKDKKQKIKVQDFRINIYLMLGKFRFLKIKINKEKLENNKMLNFNKLKERISKINIKSSDLIKNRKQFFRNTKELEINLEKLKVNLNLGIENIVILTYIVALLDILLSIFLIKKANKISSNDYQYKITPYKSKEIYFNLSINCIISIKIANIINIVLKKRGKENDGTSDRIFNGNSYEQYTRYGGRQYNNRRTYIYR